MMLYIQKNTGILILFSLTLCCLATKPSTAPGRLKSLFKKPVHEQVIQTTYPFEQPATLTVTNLAGSVTITGSADSKHVQVKATIRSSIPEYLEATPIAYHTASDGSLSLTVITPESAKKQYTIDLELNVPSYAHIKAATTGGAITACNVEHDVWATSTRGPIAITGSKGTVIAETHEAANITIDEAQGNIRAHAKKGSIYITSAQESVIAATEKGTIVISCATLPATGKLHARTGSGAIRVHLPETVNANVCAKTNHGTVECHHLITVKPFVTQWNKQAWNRIKKEVRGTLGTGESLIDLHNQRGPIVIAKR